MDVTRTGVILNTQNYRDCVSFYRDIFDLKVLFEKSEANFKLTCLTFGDSYLMIETDGISDPEGKTMAQGFLKLRFEVFNLEAALIRTQKLRPETKIIELPWGSTINIFDPDRTSVGIRDEATFTKQLNGFASV